jgi:hypothetical protein
LIAVLGLKYFKIFKLPPASASLIFRKYPWE